MLPIDLLTSIALLSLGRLAEAATASEWASRSIYQVMTDRFAVTNGSAPECDLLRYCGGTWTGIKNKLDYIQGMGFSAIQISPVVKNFPDYTLYGEAFHGYWPTDWYALNENFGTADDLKDLAKALHDRDMLLMVDVVINDMAVPIDAFMTKETVIDYSKFNPFDDEKYYHPWCNLSDYNDPPIYQDCWLSSDVIALPDLNTEDPVVEGMINTWIKELVSNYSIDGLRIDAAKHINDDFLKSFVKEAGVFSFGEVYNHLPELVCEYTEFMDGLPNFPIYYPLIQGFASGNLIPLGDMVGSMEKECKNVSYMGTFSENHDLPRFATTNPDLVLAMNLVAFTILADGIPILYQNQEQHVPGNYSPFNRGALWTEGYNTTSTLYNLTATLNKLRTHASLRDPLYISTPVKQLHLREQSYVTRKGAEGVQLIAAYFNTALLPDNSTDTLSIKGTYAPNTKLVEVLSCKSEETDGEGVLDFRIDGMPKAFYPTDMLEGSGLCGTSLGIKVDENEGKENETEVDEGEKSEGARSQVKANIAMSALMVMFLYALVVL